MQSLWYSISWLRDFTRFYEISYRLGPVTSSWDVPHCRHFITRIDFQRSFDSVIRMCDSRYWVTTLEIWRNWLPLRSGEKIPTRMPAWVGYYSNDLCNQLMIYHFMMTSSNGNIFRVTGHLCGEFTGLRWIPRTKASDAELWYFLWCARLSKHSRGWSFETLSHPLWRHRNVLWFYAGDT